MVSRERAPNGLKFDWGSECKRWGFLAAVAFWVFHPFATRRFYGTGDALWYANMLADFVSQCRAGIFPVFVGQTEYAFNGAVYPLRVAPLYQHVAGVLDLVTARQLSFFALQHLVIIATGVAGMASCYACLTALVPRYRSAATLLTTLYITCPGVLGVIFVQDLYMSWMTLPFLPLIGYGIVRSYEEDDYAAWLAIAAGLGGTWLAHAPIAMWMTAIVGMAQLIRLFFVHRTAESWKRALVGGGLLLVLAQYPFVSNFLLRMPGSPPASGGALEHPEKIVDALRTAFPACLLPLSAGASKLSDLQLGYGLGLVLLIGIVATFIKRSWPLGVLVATAAAVWLILLPIPRWSELFWLKLVPETVRRLTFYWPMHRLYLVLATVAVFIGILGVQALARYRKNLVRFLTGILALGCIWSLWENRQFQTAAALRTASAEDTERKQRPENRLLMTHAYGLFSKLPPTFSNGVMDPLAEFRLLDPTTHEPLPKTPKPPRNAIVEGEFFGTLDANPGILNLEPALTLSPGKHYDLEFTFQPRVYSGILQLVGTTFFREYALPSSGEPLAFGAVSPNSPRLPLWTTRGEDETVTLRFIPTGEAANLIEDRRFAHFHLVERTEASEAIQVKKWMPLVISVNTPSPALLETPRMATLGYHGKTNGEPVPPLVTPAGLLAVPIPTGTSEIELRFSAPLPLKLSYWTGFIAWLSLGLWLVGGRYIHRLPLLKN